VTALRLLALVGLNGALIGVPMVTASLAALQLRVRHPALVAGSALVGLAVHGSVVFWSFYFLNGDGTYIAAALVLLELGGVAALVVRRGFGALRPLAELAAPATATLVFTVFVLSFGFLRGGIEAPVQVAEFRFLPGLPIDNAVPLKLSQAVDRDVRPLPDPLYSNWSPSDRPPLQSGIHLAATSLYGRERLDLEYTVVGALLQSLWVFGLWAFFAAARTARPLAATTTGAILLSGFTVLNGFYVWPKLLSAAYLLIVAAVFLTPESCRILSERGCAILVGLSVGGAMLSHSGALIPLLALVLFLLVRRQVPSWRFLAHFALAAVLVVGPWFTYQKLVNPPGDRVLRLQVAGRFDSEGRGSLLREIADHYREVGPRDTVANKLENLAEPFRGTRSTLTDLWQVAEHDLPGARGDRQLRDQALLGVRVNQTFRLVPALGLLILGPIVLGLVLLLRNPTASGGAREIDLRLEWSLLLFLGLTIAVWSLVLFGPRYTVLHQGSYLTPILAFVLCTAACWKLSPAATVGIVAVHCAAVLYLHKDLPVGAPLDFFPGGGSVVVLAFLSLAASLALLATGFSWRSLR
jgi:hypothetical protein